MEIKDIAFVESALWELDNGEIIKAKDKVKINYFIESNIEDFIEYIDFSKSKSQDSEKDFMGDFAKISNEDSKKKYKYENFAEFMLHFNATKKIIESNFIFNLQDSKNCIESNIKKVDTSLTLSMTDLDFMESKNFYGRNTPSFVNETATLNEATTLCETTMFNEPTPLTTLRKGGGNILTQDSVESKKDFKQSFIESSVQNKDSIESKNIQNFKMNSVESQNAQDFMESKNGLDSTLDSMESKNPTDSKKDLVNLALPYALAPGTYIELEALIDSKKDSKIDSKIENSKIESNTKPTIESKIKNSNKDSKIESKPYPRDKIPIKWAYIAFYHDSIPSKKVIESKLDSINTHDTTTNNHNKKDVIYKILEDKSGYFAKNNMNEKIGFHLPFSELENLQEPKENHDFYPTNPKENQNFSLEFQSKNPKNDFSQALKSQTLKNHTFKTPNKPKNYRIYVIIFAFLNNFKHNKPSINDKFIALDVSFFVGIKENESKTQTNHTIKQTIYAFSPSQINKNKKEKPLDSAYQNIIEIYEKSGIKGINEIDRIYDLPNAIFFLMACHRLFSSPLKSLRIYPQLSAKIALIYRTFNIQNDDFLASLDYKNGIRDSKNSLNDGLKYLWNLKDDFALKAANLYNNFFGSEMYNAFYKDKGIESKLKLLREFEKILSEIFNIYDNFRPKIESYDDSDRSCVGYFCPINNVIGIKKSALRCDIHNILYIFLHEYRHFYVHYLMWKSDFKHEMSENIIMLFLKWSIDITRGKVVLESFGDPYKLDIDEKDAFKLGDFLSTALHGIHKIKFRNAWV